MNDYVESVRKWIKMRACGHNGPKTRERYEWLSRIKFADEYINEARREVLKLRREIREKQTIIKKGKEFFEKSGYRHSG
jgi:hypothetical protein